MNLKSYINLYRKNDKFSKKEAFIFGIPLPLEKGWALKYENIEITSQQRELLIPFMNTKRAKRTLRRMKEQTEKKKNSF